MEKTSLKLREFYSLQVELNGLVGNKTGEIIAKALLSEKIKLTTKYWLTDLDKKVSTERETIEKLREELMELEKQFNTKKEEFVKIQGALEAFNYVKGPDIVV